MNLQNRSLLYFDESFLDTCYSYTYNEMVILYNGLKEVQAVSDFRVTLDISHLREFYAVEEDVIQETINRFCATAPVKPILYGWGRSRETLFPVKRAYADYEKDVLFIEFDECIKSMVIDIKNPMVLNLDIIKNFKKKKDRQCYDIRFYEYLSCVYNSIGKNGTLYIPFTMDEILFISSVFNLNIKKYLKQYLEGKKIYDIARNINDDEERLRIKCSWGVFSRSYVKQSVELMNEKSDIYIDGYKRISYLAKTTGVIFKVRRNPKRGYLGYLKDIVRKKTKDEEDFYNKCCDIYENE